MREDSLFGTVPSKNHHPFFWETKCKITIPTKIPISLIAQQQSIETTYVWRTERKTRFPARAQYLQKWRDSNQLQFDMDDNVPLKWLFNLYSYWFVIAYAFNADNVSDFSECILCIVFFFLGRSWTVYLSNKLVNNVVSFPFAVSKNTCTR